MGMPDFVTLAKSRRGSKLWNFMEWTALRIVFALATFWRMILREISNA